MKSTFTRDVSQELIDALLDKTKLLAFLDFVKKHSELGLCFRGNDSEKGRVTIYKNNHMIWDLTIDDDNKPKVGISADHSRFMTNWNEYIEKLMDLGFKGTNGEDYKTLYDTGRLVSRSHNTKKDTYNYSIIDLAYNPSGSTYEDISRVVEESFILLDAMHADYFNPAHTEAFDIYNARSKKTKREIRPKNYIKEYYFKSHEGETNEDKNISMHASFQNCVEKHAQQDLFLSNHLFKDGLFIYDLEFMQPGGRTSEVKNSNKPDMFGIRFDKKGNPVAICMIEVKSTPSALNQNSGLKAHLEGMEEYFQLKTSEGWLMDDRIKEACKILNQYHELGLYGVPKDFSENEFLGIDQEIIFVFTNEVTIESRLKGTRKDNKRILGPTCAEVLSGYVPYSEMYFGDYCEHIDVVKKGYPIKL